MGAFADKLREASPLAAYFGPPRTYTTSEAGLRNLLGHDRYEWLPEIHEGDIVPSGGGLRLVRRVVAAFDDYIFRPLSKVSPLLLGVGTGVLFDFGWKAWIGIGLTANYAPGDIGEFAQGVILGSLAAVLWKIDWTLGGAAFGSIGAGGAFRFPGGITGGF
jgi:hypothetical protein